MRTARLTLRRPRAADFDAVFRIHGDPRTNLHNPDGPQRDRREAETLLAYGGFAAFALPQPRSNSRSRS